MTECRRFCWHWSFAWAFFSGCWR